MFLVQDQIGDSTYLVLTGEDPRRSGYAGKVTDDAKWVAKKHFIADSGTREIGYLPREAPIDEIRLLWK